MCLAKSLAGGLPLGVTLGTNDIMSSLKVGEHTSTFGGNPLVCAAASAAIDVLIEEKLVERAAELGGYFRERLDRLSTNHKIIREIRGLGLMIGVEFRFDILNLLMKSMSKGVLVLDAGRNVLRFLPPLVIEKAQLDRVSDVLDGAIGEEENERLRSSTSR
jgi:acetylornithine/LysW-gamma-L-lysine aminotransferase